MAKNINPPKAAKPTTPRFNDVKFVNWSLDAEQKQQCKAWLLSEGDIANAMDNTIQAGYKITTSWDGFRSCYTCSLVPTESAKSNHGYILTGKGSTSLKAVKQALFIHYLVMDEDWAAYSTAGNAEELDD